MVDLYDQFHSPLLREWELDENATHYERVGAAPTNQEMMKMWTAWSITTYAFAIYTASVLVALVCTPKIRKRPFNLFLIYLMVPDTLVLWLCGTSCLLNALAGKFTSIAHCKFQAVYLCATVGANAWLNAAITRHLLDMLRCARKFIKYQPPTRKQVTIEAVLIYALNVFIASWFTVTADWWPFQTRLNSGVVCLPQDFDHLSTALYYGVFFPSFFLIPFLYVCYAVFVIWKQNLMPPSGRKRALAMYFFRLVVAFVVMWVPSLVLLVVTSPWTSPWVAWAGGFWGHLQGVVSGVVSLFKPDIRKAYVAFYKPIRGCCYCSCFSRQQQQSTIADQQPHHHGGVTTHNCESSSAAKNNSFSQTPRQTAANPSTASSSATGSSFLQSMFFSNHFSGLGRLSRAGSNSGAEILDDLGEEEEEKEEQMSNNDVDDDEESQSTAAQFNTTTVAAEESDSISDG